MTNSKRHGSAWRFQICPVLFNSLGFPFCSESVIFFFCEYENAIKGYYDRQTRKNSPDAIKLDEKVDNKCQNKTDDCRKFTIKTISKINSVKDSAER